MVHVQVVEVLWGSKGIRELVIKRPFRVRFSYLPFYLVMRLLVSVLKPYLVMVCGVTFVRPIAIIFSSRLNK